MPRMVSVLREVLFVLFSSVSFAVASYVRQALWLVPDALTVSSSAIVTFFAAAIVGAAAASDSSAVSTASVSARSALLCGL